MRHTRPSATSPAFLAMLAARNERAKQEADAGAETFMGFPDRWFDDPHWRCINGHVSTSYLKSEAYGGDCCLACREYVILTHPEDVEDVTG